MEAPIRQSMFATIAVFWMGHKQRVCSCIGEWQESVLLHGGHLQDMVSKASNNVVLMMQQATFSISTVRLSVPATWAVLMIGKVPAIGACRAF